MTWTTDKPTVPGWYWWRRLNRPDWPVVASKIVLVIDRDGGLYQLSVGWHEIRDWYFECSEWAGPIPVQGGDEWKR